MLDQAIALMVAPRAQHKQVRLTGHVEDGVVRRRIGHLLRLRQVLVNLLYNAIKYTHEGWVDARVRATVDDALIIEVEDTGIGIAPEQQAAVFEPFMQAASDQPREGFGLGLAITRELVAAIGGTIELASQPGVGTTFTVRLRLRPATDEHPLGVDRLRAIEPGSAPMGPVGPRPLRVLLAEDDPRTPASPRRSSPASATTFTGSATASPRSTRPSARSSTSS